MSSSALSIAAHFSPYIALRTALGAYDYMLTLQDEWSLVWQRKWRGSTWLFVANRLLMLANVVLCVMPFNEQVRAIFYLHGVCANYIVLEKMCAAHLRYLRTR